jgi:fumarate reductase flavoprotein subunit
MKDKSWDVIVVGGGGSGLAAAAAAAEEGAKTIVLEKASRIGGSTLLSVGSISAPMTRLQQRRNIPDDIESFIIDSNKFNAELSERDNGDLRRRMVEEGASTVAWLEGLGVGFVGPFPEPPHRVPRMLNVVPGSHAYVNRLADYARSKGAEVLTGVAAVGLTHGEGRVTGVVIESSQGRSELSARGGVVLAAGDFSGNPEMRARFIRPEAAHVGAVNPLSTGDGIRLGEDAGADMVNMDITDGPQLRFPLPPKPSLFDRLPTGRFLSRMYSWLGNSMPQSLIRKFSKQMLTAWMAPAPGFLDAGPLLVNRDGRLVKDTGDGRAYAVAAQPEMKAYLILSEALARDFSSGEKHISTAPGIAYAYWPDYRSGRPDLITRATTIKELATKLQMEPETLCDTVNAERGRLTGSSVFSRGPYYAMGPLLSVFVTTEGGLRVDSECRVLDRKGKVVPGLWAAGSNGQSGLVLNGHGLHILWAMASGRISGRSAALEAQV